MANRKFAQFIIWKIFLDRLQQLWIVFGPTGVEGHTILDRRLSAFQIVWPSMADRLYRWHAQRTGWCPTPLRVGLVPLPPPLCRVKVLLQVHGEGLSPSHGSSALVVFLVHIHGGFCKNLCVFYDPVAFDMCSWPQYGMPLTRRVFSSDASASLLLFLYVCSKTKLIEYF